MTLPFTPKFRDLVRVHTTTSGTGPLVPGAAVPGFSTFGDALGVGDRFYYCAQSVARPAEREVGRGTLQADGSIARDPIGGAVTSFGSGTKTVSLVAAAEWFASVSQGSGSSPGDADIAVRSRADLAARSASRGAAVMLTEEGREGLFVFTEGDLARKVAGDPAQGLFVAPTAEPTGATGAWVRKYEGPANLRWFGAVPDDDGVDGTDNHPAIVAALSALAMLGVSDLWDRNCTPGLFIPLGFYFVGKTIDLKQSLRITGEGTGSRKNAGTRLRFPPDTTGIVVNDRDTLGDDSEEASTSASGAIIENLSLHGGGGAEGHGIRLRARATVRDFYIENFGKDGINIFAAAATGGATGGNANNFLLRDGVSFANGRHGIYCHGADANAGTGIALDCSHNACWGIFDDSFLGNVWYGCHTDQNGARQWVQGAAEGVGLVSHDGGYYACVIGQEAAASTTVPGTNDGVWCPSSSNYYAPSWRPEIVVRSGGPYGANNPNSRTRFYGCYCEGGQGPVQLFAKAMFDGFADEVGYLGAGRTFIGDGNRMTFSGGLESLSGDWIPHGRMILSGDQNFTGARANAYLYRNSTSGLTMYGDGSIDDLTVANREGATVLTVPSGTQNAKVWGDLEIAGTIKAARGLSAGVTEGDKGDIVVSNSGASWNVEGATPAGGDFNLAGRLVVSSDRGFGGLAGKGAIYKSAVDGLAIVGAVGSTNDFGFYTPQGAAVFVVPTSTTEVRFGGSFGLLPGLGIGGSAVQANSKTGPVSLNKTSGRITLHDAPIPVGGVVSFTLSNTTVGAGDLVLVNIAGNASPNAYAADVTAVSQGSCRIQIRNLADAELAEPVMLNFMVLKSTTS